MFKKCVFCDIVSGIEPAAIVYQNDEVLIFLEQRPLFFGHCLLIPKQHHETLNDLPPDLLPSFFAHLQAINHVVIAAMDAEGSFVALNNIVSQSVPHLHVHIVPRNRGDGLKGFFWPRTRYPDNAMTAVCEALQNTWQSLYGNSFWQN